MLKLVSHPAEPWQRQPDEPEEAFDLFTKWLLGSRGLPHAPQTAAAFRWAERARQYDDRLTQPKPEDAIAHTIQNLRLLIQKESVKFLRNSAATDAPTITIGDASKLLAVLQGLQALPETDDLDLSRLNPEDLKNYFSLYEKMSKVG